MNTLDQLVTTFGIEVDAHLDRQVSIPVLTEPQRQGDVYLRPARPDVKAATTPVPTAGVPVVRGENGGNTHAIVATPGSEVYVDVQEASADSLRIAVLTVASGEAYLAHPEHGYNGIGPGTYVLLRQREQAEELRMVAD